MGDLRCVVCGETGLAKAEGGDLLCPVCDTRFPIVAGIAVTLSRPLVKVVEEHRRYESARSSTLAQAELLEAFADARPVDSASPRMRRMADGMRANQELADELFRPLEAAAAAGRDADSPLHLLYRTFALGYDFELLLAYLYQDWAGGPAFSAIRARVLDAVERHAGGPQTALVLGSGTGGLVHALAGVVPRVSAVDLSLTAHLLAQRMLAGGGELAIRLFSRKVSIAAQNDCAAARLVPPPAAAGAIRMLCADAARLPQASGETTLVVTQYLLDLVPDRERIVREIHRVLATGGLWINFGLPFGRAGEEATVGTRDQHELPEFFREHGFEPREIDRGPFDLLDRTAVLPHSTLVVDHPLFFVARKIADGGDAVDSRLFFDYFSGRDDAVLAKVPVLEQEIGFTESEIYGGPGRRSDRKLWLGSPAAARTVPERLAGWMRSLAEGLTKGLTLGQLASRFDAHGPSELPLADLVETFRLLSEQKIVDLH